MAKNLTIEELKAHLSDGERIRKQPFELLKELSRLLNSGEEHRCRDLVLHALENRDAFGEFEPILEALVRELGLFPYIDDEILSLTDSIAYEYHRPINYDEPIVFHREQALVYRRLLDGDNIILSAPTSFGKSKVIDAIIAVEKHRNVVVIVPTLALIDETRRRLARFYPKYKIITQISQLPGDRNIFIFTAERANVYEHFPRIDFFVMDEFYKIGALDEDRKRTVALNQAFYKLSKGGAQFYLLGPCVNKIPDGLEERFDCRFFRTTFATVAAEEIKVSSSSDELGALCELIASLKGEPTLIFCKSPPRVNEVCRALLQAGVTEKSSGLESATKWMRDNFHPDWILPNAFERGIGLHHGKLPRSLGQFVVRAFNTDRLKILACTSTLIEGVNTKAKNVIIFDNKIAKEKFDFFTFNNIKGRSGRMFHHFVGRVFLFHEPPTDPLPFVDFPFYTQNGDAPDSILVHMDEKDLSAESKARIGPILHQTDLPLELLKKHSSIEPNDLLELAKRLKTALPQERALLAWTNFPKGPAFNFVCSLMWEHFIHRGHAGVLSAKQLARNVWNLNFKPDIRQRILAELQPGPFAAASVDDAVERILEFERTWASFELPRLLRAFSDVRRHVLGGVGDYSFFASQLENLFRKPFQVALEEFGIPIQVSDKIASILDGVDSFDAVLNVIRKIPINRFGLDAFEQELLKDSQTAI
jgi:rhodanese-related sulfurtransferase